MPNLKISNLHVETATKPILKGINLYIKPGLVYIIMGPNGSGKSTLASTIMGHPAYTITKGKINFAGNIAALTPDERSLRGIFMSFQNPPTIAGVKVSTMLRLAVNTHRNQAKLPPLSVTDFIKQLRVSMDLLQIPHQFASRCVNDGFSGGERKRLEILQALLLKPKLVILDEIDSGLDIDAIKIVAKGVNQLQKNGAAILIITHYQRILKHLTANSVHILADGIIARSGDMRLVEELEQSSYQALINAA